MTKTVALLLTMAFSGIAVHAQTITVTPNGQQPQEVSYNKKTMQKLGIAELHER